MFCFALSSPETGPLTPTPFPLIEVSGTPEERGRSHGRQAAERVRRSAALYGAAVTGLGLDAAAAARLARRFLPRVEAYDEDMAREMRGIAEGAGVSLEDVLLVNCRREVLQLAALGDDGEDPDGCTGVVAFGAATGGGPLIHAQNWDWRAECAATSILLRIRREDGPDLLTFTEAGALARSGLNAAGLALTANNLNSDRDFREVGVPLPLIRRRILECAYVADAVQAIISAPKSGSNNMILSHADGWCASFECAPDEAFVVKPEAGLLVHANHWVSPAALARLRDTGLAGSPDSIYRDDRVTELLAPHRGRIGGAEVTAALLDSWQGPHAVCRPPRPARTGGGLSATVATIVMHPAEGRLSVAPLPAVGGTFEDHVLAPDRAATRAAA